jgi:hypothetical protein
MNDIRTPTKPGARQVAARQGSLATKPEDKLGTLVPERRYARGQIIEVSMQHQRPIKEMEKVSFPRSGTARALPIARPLLTEDMKASASKFRAEADLAEQIARSATDLEKRKVYDGLADHFRQLADAIVAGRTA